MLASIKRFWAERIAGGHAASIYEFTAPAARGVAKEPEVLEERIAPQGAQRILTYFFSAAGGRSADFLSPPLSAFSSASAFLADFL